MSDSRPIYSIAHRSIKKHKPHRIPKIIQSVILPLSPFPQVGHPIRLSSHNRPILTNSPGSHFPEVDHPTVHTHHGSRTVSTAQQWTARCAISYVDVADDICRRIAKGAFGDAAEIDQRRGCVAVIDTEAEAGGVVAVDYTRGAEGGVGAWHEGVWRCRVYR